MKMIEVKNENNEIVGYVSRFRGAAFANYATAYTPLDINKYPISGVNSLNSLDSAIDVVLNYVNDCQLIRI